MAALLGLFAGLHVFLRLARSSASERLLPVVALLVSLGWIEIFRINPALAQKQLIWLGASAAVFVLSYLVLRDYSFLEDYRYLILTAGLVLQLLVMIFGQEVNGARLWFRVGIFNFQPVEMVKLFLIVFLAAYLRQYRRYLALPLLSRNFALPLQGLVPILLMWGLCECVLVVQKDLGMALLFFGVFLTLFYLATGRKTLALAGAALLAGGFFVAYHLFGHVRTRVQIWLNPWDDAFGRGFQIVQALIAAAWGGLWGTGLGCGNPSIIPAVTTDMIIVALSEEMGLATALIIIIAFWLIFNELIAISMSCRKELGALLAGGFAFLVALQSIIIIAGDFKLIPLTGITLPFVSYGGSSLVSNFLLLAMVLRIAEGRDCTNPPDARGLYYGTLRTVFFILFALPAGYLIWFQAMQAPGLKMSQTNPRLKENIALRGSILDRAGKPLAHTIGANGDIRRTYPAGPASATLIGYDDPRYGLSGLELELNCALLGRRRPQTLEDALWLMRHGTLKGRRVILTLDRDLQERAYSLIEKRRGAIVAMTLSGEIIAAASSPSFDPATLDRDWESLKERKDAPFLNRALNGLYPPGSTFKILTMAAGLESGAVSLDDSFECRGSYSIGSYRLRDAHRAVHGILSATDALVHSCNIAFAQMGLRITAPVLEDYARRFRLDEAFNPGAPVTAGQFPPVEKLTPGHLAQCSFGQGEILLTPLHVALMTAVFAEHGVMPEPRLLKDGKVATHRVITPTVADQVRAMMVQVVERGSGRAARLRGLTVAGKTGTAEHPGSRTHAWFTCFAPEDRPRLIVTVIIEEGGWGGNDAAPLAREIISFALHKYE
jgi:peptidoglycan glycosyltransferase